MKAKAADFLVYDEVNQIYRENPEQAVRDDVEKHYWLHVCRTVAKDWRLYLMLIPMLLVFLFWRYFPMYELLGCFKVSDEVKPVAEQLFAGFSNFKVLLVGDGSKTTEFWRAMRNTFLLSFYGLCFGFPMPIILALFFNEIKSNIARSVYQVMTYLPKFMSTVVMTSLVTMLVKQGSLTSNMGIVSQLLCNLGLISQEVAQGGLLNQPGFFRAIYQISGIWKSAGYDSIVFFAAIIAISPTSYEAAQIDGAGKMAQMKYVVLPSILSTIVIMLITRIGSLLNIGYEKVLLLYNTNTYVTADVVSTFAQRYGMAGAAKGIASAAEMMNNVVGMLLVIGANTIARKASDVSLYSSWAVDETRISSFWSNYGKKQKNTPLRSPEQLREISDYYKLNTKAVDDLVTANAENAPEVSKEELEKYRSKSGLHLPRWLKVVLLKAWFAGAACFFIFWGLGIYLPNLLDMMLVFGISLGLVTDLLVNNVLRFLSTVPGENDEWMMFPKKGMIAFFLNILYAFVLLFCVYAFYQVINTVIVSVTGRTDTVPLGVEPVLFGLFYMGFDLLFVGMKHLGRRILADAMASAKGKEG